MRVGLGDDEGHFGQFAVLRKDRQIGDGVRHVIGLARAKRIHHDGGYFLIVEDAVDRGEIRVVVADVDLLQIGGTPELRHRERFNAAAEGHRFEVVQIVHQRSTDGGDRVGEDEMHHAVAAGGHTQHRRHRLAVNFTRDGDRLALQIAIGDKDAFGPFQIPEFAVGNFGGDGDRGRADVAGDGETELVIAKKQTAHSALLCPFETVLQTVVNDVVAVFINALRGAVLHGDGAAGRGQIIVEVLLFTSFFVVPVPFPIAVLIFGQHDRIQHDRLDRRFDDGHRELLIHAHQKDGGGIGADPPRLGGRLIGHHFRMHVIAFVLHRIRPVVKNGAVLQRDGEGIRR